VDRIEGYVRTDDLDGVRRTYDSAPSRGRRQRQRGAPASDAGVAVPGERRMSRLVVAADLRNAGDERSVRAACGLLSSVGDATGR
jgi:hypothetical protein